MSRKQSIGWHEEWVVSRERSLAELKNRYIVLSRRITSTEREVAWERARIAEARRRGIKAFDPERFMMRNGEMVWPNARITDAAPPSGSENTTDATWRRSRASDC